MDLPDKPWKAMYRALLWRVTELVEDGEGWTGVDHPSITELRRVVDSHNDLWEDSEGSPTKLVDMPELNGEEGALSPNPSAATILGIAGAMGITPEHLIRHYLKPLQQSRRLDAQDTSFDSQGTS